MAGWTLPSEGVFWHIERIVLNRKNSLFVGNPRGGRTAAILSSITSTCRRHRIDPQLHFTQLLTNLFTTPSKRTRRIAARPMETPPTETLAAFQNAADEAK